MRLRWSAGAVASTAALALAASLPVRAAPLDVWIVLDGPVAARQRVDAALRGRLERTPLRHRTRIVTTDEPPAGEGLVRALALVEARLEEGAGAARVELSRGGEALSPGWLVHAVLRSADAVDSRVGVVDRRSSWTAQLAARATVSTTSPAASAALAAGVPAIALRLPSSAVGEGDGETAARLLAALVRRLDGLAGRPHSEDRYLVAGERVWLRRDLYWLGLALWLLLFWRSWKRRPRAALPPSDRELRWLLLLAWLAAPVFAVVLLSLPALAAAWRSPRPPWLSAVALLPTVSFATRLGLDLAAGARPVISLLPTSLVAATLAVFLWAGRRAASAATSSRRQP